MGFSLNGMSNPGRWKNCLYTYMTRSTVWNIESRDASRAISCTGGQRIRKHRISHHTPGSVKKRSRISNRRQHQFPLPLLLHDSTAHQTHGTTQHSTDHKTKTSMHERFIAPPLLHLCPRSSSTVKWPSLLCLRRSNSNNSHWQ